MEKVRHRQSTHRDVMRQVLADSTDSTSSRGHKVTLFSIARITNPVVEELVR